MHKFMFRPNTLDRHIYAQVVAQNEYRLPRSLSEDDVVIDVGGHIGSFAYAAHMRGSRNIHVYEAHPENAKMCMTNLNLPGIVVYNKGVWRSDQGDEYTLSHTGFDYTPQGVNTGGGNVLWTENATQTLEAVSLDSILREFEHVHTLKVDAETSEFPILLTSSELHRVSYIVGEFHEVNGLFDAGSIPEHAAIEGYTSFTIEQLAMCLQLFGFVTNFQRFTPTSHIGLFFARRV